MSTPAWRTFGLVALCAACTPTPEPLPARIISKSSLTSGEQEATVAVGPSGAVAVAWIGGPTQSGEKNAIGFRISRTGGVTWGSVGRLRSPTGGRSTDPVVTALPDGSFALVFVDPDGGDLSRTYLARAAPGSSRFEDPVDVSGPPPAGAFFDKPWLATTAGGVLLLSVDVIGGTPQTALLRSEDGLHWAPVSMPVTPARQGFLCAPRSAGRVWLVQHSLRDVVATFSDDEGKTWAKTLFIDSPATLTSPTTGLPTCAAGADDAWFAWGIEDGGVGEVKKDVEVRVVHFSAGRFTRVPVEAPEGRLFMSPQLALTESGAVHLLSYFGRSEGDRDGGLQRASAEDPGKGFGAPVLVHGPITFTTNRSSEWYGDYLGVAARDGGLHVAYGDNQVDGTRRVAFERIDAP